MSDGKRIELKGKSVHKITSYFQSPITYSFDVFCQFDEIYDEAIKPIALVLKDYMSEVAVHQHVYASVVVAEDEIHKTIDAGGEIDEATARDSIVRTIVEDLSGFPRSYEWRIEFPRFYRLPDSKIEVNKDMYFDFKTGKFPDLVLKVYGYCGTDFNQPAVVKMLSAIKSLIFVLEWSKVVHETHSFDDLKVIVFDNYLGLEKKQFLKSDLSRLIGGSRLSVSLEARKMGVKNTNVASILSTSFSQAGKVVELLQLEENAAIATAIDWYMDSRLVENQTVALLEVCIGLEAILGDDGEIKDMTNRLCDRLGFLLGKSRDQRRIFSEQYRAVLSLRGKLVHGKQAKLDQDGAKTLSVARDLLRDVIEHELIQITK
ncbi:HEPN domain-containing protein [Janthinobacterium sp. NKUCC08_JDC]|uniref:HEPN domain-containing protein n=1 Tax=Janthinobacterium sp. NKUCC08_JDC TaxID=2842122 RepID=UPI001C5B9766|nr:HEPN domain-containing protein [Janthinobacterium sp. NKUCC08_JDC]MBW3498861.1 hypothetical protein [Janthinobacterium sp. NKUCC08_JDC]